MHPTTSMAVMIKQKKITLVQQMAALKRTFPESHVNYDYRQKRLVWEGILQPTTLSKKYKVKITCDGISSIDYKPNIYVISPKPLSLAENEKKLPHTYDSKQQQICLYDWRCNEWNETMMMSHTIIPWATEWLYFYEIWVATGEWYGGGHHSSPSTEKT